MRLTEGTLNVITLIRSIRRTTIRNITVVFCPFRPGGLKQVCARYITLAGYLPNIGRNILLCHHVEKQFRYLLKYKRV